MKLINKSKNIIISENVIIADSFFKRLKGLMFTKELPDQNALLIKPCNEIHTFNMNYSIDVLYIDVNNKILAISEDMKPGIIGKCVKNAISVVELPCNKIRSSNIKVGDIVDFISS